MKLIALVLFMSIQGCGKAERHIDPAFQPALNEVRGEFEKIGANVPLTGVSIEFGDPHGGEGRCYNQTGLIIIDEAYYRRSSPVAQKYLLAHEIGHCVLGRAHDNSTIDIEGRTIEGSIMNSSSVRPSFYAPIANDYYFQELVKNL